VENEISFPEYKWNGIFKKNKIDGNQIYDSPKIIECGRKKSSGMLSYSVNEPQDIISRPNP
jgi:hypothetical protein